MNELFINLSLTVASVFFSWLFTRIYYLKSLRQQNDEHAKELKALNAAIQNKTQLDSLLLKQNHVDAAVECWRLKGGPTRYIDSLLDSTQEEKAEIYHSACVRHKGRVPKQNPYL
jgi:hypothetical protein